MRNNIDALVVSAHDLSCRNADQVSAHKNLTQSGAVLREADTTEVPLLQMMALLKWDSNQNRWTQEQAGSCLEAVAARRKARPLLPTGNVLHSSSSIAESMQTERTTDMGTVKHHAANLQQTQASTDAKYLVLEISLYMHAAARAREALRWSSRSASNIPLVHA